MMTNVGRKYSENIINTAHADLILGIADKDIWRHPNEKTNDCDLVDIKSIFLEISGVNNVLELFHIGRSRRRFRTCHNLVTA